MLKYPRYRLSLRCNRTPMQLRQIPHAPPCLVKTTQRRSSLLAPQNGAAHAATYSNDAIKMSPAAQVTDEIPHLILFPDCVKEKSHVESNGSADGQPNWVSTLIRGHAHSARSNQRPNLVHRRAILHHLQQPNHQATQNLEVLQQRQDFWGRYPKWTYLGFL